MNTNGPLFRENVTVMADLIRFSDPVLRFSWIRREQLSALAGFAARESVILRD